MRSALDLMAVCHRLRDIVEGDALFWGAALLLRPPSLHKALTRAMAVKEPKLAFTAHGGACLCVLHVLLNHMEFVTHGHGIAIHKRE